MMTDSEALSIAAIVIAILRRDGYISHHRRESVRGKEGPPGLPGLPGLAGAPGKDGKKGDKGDKGDRGDSTPYLPSPWRIYVDFSSTNPMEDGTEHNPYHSMAPAMNKWKTLGGIPAHVLIGGQGGAVSAPVVVPDGCTGCIEGLDSATPTIGTVSIAAGNSSGSGQVVLRHLGTGAITIRDRVGAVAGDLGFVVLDSVTVTGGITSQNGLHSALVLASGTSQVTPTNLSPSMVLEGGPLNLRSGLLIADNARISGGLECGSFHISGCFYVGTLNLKAPFPYYSRFLRTEFLDPFTIDADAAADVWFDAQSAERFGLISADCTTNVTALSNGFGPMLRRLSAAVNAFDPVRATAALTAGPAAGVPDNDVIGICYPGRLQDQIALIWPSGTQVPAQPGASGTYYRDNATGTATKTPPVGSQRLFHCDGSVCAVGLSYQESV